MTGKVEEYISVIVPQVPQTLIDPFMWNESEISVYYNCSFPPDVDDDNQTVQSLGTT